MTDIMKKNSELMDKAWDWWTGLDTAYQDEYLSRWVLAKYKEIKEIK